MRMEEVKRKRGRPRIDTHITEEIATSRRQAVNKVYMYEGVYLLSAAAAEIPNGQLLWQADHKAMTLKCRDGILEQLGRMVMQDRLSHEDCVYLANLAADAVEQGHTTRQVELALREIRMAAKSSLNHPESPTLNKALGRKVDILRMMGEIK